MKLKKKAQVTMYFVMIALAVIIVLITAVIAPMGTVFNTEMYKAGESILDQANDSIMGIQDPNVRAAVLSQLQEAQGQAQNNIDVTLDFYTYSWIFVIGLTAFVAFLYTRRLVETTGGGGFI